MSEKTKPLTQREAVLQHMQTFGSITSWEAFTDYGITRLAGIIHSLRRDEQMHIVTEDVTTQNRFGHAVTYAKYSIAPPAPEPAPLAEGIVQQHDGQLAIEV